MGSDLTHLKNKSSLEVISVQRDLKMTFCKPVAISRYLVWSGTKLLVGSVWACCSCQCDQHSHTWLLDEKLYAIPQQCVIKLVTSHGATRLPVMVQGFSGYFCCLFSLLATRAQSESRPRLSPHLCSITHLPSITCDYFCPT